MARRAGHHNQQPDEVSPEEIVETFRQASRTMPTPTAAICADCGYLRTTPWVKGMVGREQEPWEVAEREALSGLQTALRYLPEVLQVYRGLAGIAPPDMRGLAVLARVHEMLPAAIAALELSSRQPSQSALWHLPAELIRHGCYDRVASRRLDTGIRLLFTQPAGALHPGIPGSGQRNSQ